MNKLVKILILNSFVIGFISGNVLAKESPLCSSAMVRLSLSPLFCIDDDLNDGLFDIPEVGLDMEDLQSIFDGAESSGGHGISPMNRPASPLRRRLLVDANFYCQASLLTDGGKRVSFLSFNEINFTSKLPVSYFKPLNWNHGLSTQEGNWVSIEIAPSVGVPNISVEVYSQNSETVLSVCQGQVWDRVCVDGLFSKSTLMSSVKLSTVNKEPYILRELGISCQIR